MKWEEQFKKHFTARFVIAAALHSKTSSHALVSSNILSNEVWQVSVPSFSLTSERYVFHQLISSACVSFDIMFEMQAERAVNHWPVVLNVAGRGLKFLFHAQPKARSDAKK